VEKVAILTAQLLFVVCRVSHSHCIIISCLQCCRSAVKLLFNLSDYTVCSKRFFFRPEDVPVNLPKMAATSFRGQTLRTNRWEMMREERCDAIYLLSQR